MDMNIVRDLLDAHWDRLLPVQPEAFARGLGYEIKTISNIDLDPENRGYSGYAKIENGRKIIAVNRSEHPNRQRFTIAHEIGHHLLGHTQSGRCLRDNPNNYSSRVGNSIEAEANEFAAQLIMPEEAVRVLIERRGLTDVRELATAFSVSEAAMYFRLKNLGLMR